MAYIGKSIESGTFKVLNTSGNTYNGSNATFDLGTQVGSAAQLLVSHDGVIQKPGTDYTLASNGTQITFTTEPASGASIFIVEISGAVGGTVTPSDNSVGVTQLNLSDGSNGQFIKTDGSGTLSFASVASLAGIDDQSSSNDDQLTITDTAVVINEDSDDVDFRVESNGNANMLTVNGGGDRVGIGADPDLGTGLHIKTADSGGDAHADADELVIEQAGAHVGMTFLNSGDNKQTINFGDAGDNNVGQIFYNHGDNTMEFVVDTSSKIRIDESNTYGKTMIEVATSGSFLGGDGVGEGVLSIVADVGNGQQGMGIRNSNTHSSGGGHKLIQFQNSSGGDAGEISHTASTTVSYSTSSDYRLKENESLISDGITRIKKLKPYRFNWKVEPDRVVDGFFAHEVQGIVDEAISGTKDETHTKTNCVLNNDGTLFASGVSEEKWTQGKIDGAYASNSTWIASKVLPKHQSIDQSKLVPLLTAALKESIAKIESLEARVTTLES
jgi:hypothetical protein